MVRKIILIIILFSSLLNLSCPTDTFQSYQGYSKIVNNTEDTINLYINEKFLTKIAPKSVIKFRAYAGMNYSFLLYDDNDNVYSTGSNMFDDKYLNGYIGDTLIFKYRLRDYIWPMRYRDTLIVIEKKE